jgi:predicted CopG family antitoxin
MNKDGSETIRVMPVTKERLKSLASYNESMDDIITRLLDKKPKQKKEVAT